MSVSDYNTDPDLNTSISGINIAEGCPPSGINNAIRQLMADIVGDLLQLSGGTMTGDIQSGETLFVVQKTTDDGTLILRGGSGYANGANLYLRGKDHSSEPGNLFGNFTDGNVSTNLFMKPDGTFTWGGKNVERVASIGSGYIRFVSGLQICWGAPSISAATSISFPQAFSGTAPTVVATTNHTYACSVTSLTTTSFTASMTAYSGTFRYVAIGNWS